MKKVLTVFLSIALVLTMIPGMVFAAEDNAEDTKLYCFDTYNVFVNDEGYIAAKDSNETVSPADAPEIAFGNKSYLYFAIKDGDKYKAVKPVNCNDTKNVNCEKGGDDWEYKISITELGENYKFSYVNEDKKEYELTMKCVLPYEGCYSSETASQNTYLDYFQYSTDSNEFYIISQSNYNITKVKYVENYDSGEEIDEMVAVSGVTIENVTNNKVKKVVVNGDVFNEETQKLEGQIVIAYKDDENKTCTNSFWFEIWGPNYNPEDYDDEDITADIEFYSDEKCSDKIKDFSVNTSLEPANNCFYIKSTVGEPVISEIATYYTEWNDKTKEMVSYTGHFDCTNDDATEEYVETDEYGEEKTEAYIPKTDINKTTNTKPNDFVGIEPVNSDEGIYKLAFKAAKTYSYRGHERTSFKITAGEANNACKYLNVDYGLNILYNEGAFERIMPTNDYFDYILETGMKSPNFKKVESGKVYWGNLGGQSSNITARCGEEVIIALDTAAGYSIESIKNAVNGKELPCTIQAEYYYKVYDGDTEIIANDDLLNENRDFDLGSISSWDDDNIKYAFWALQRVGKTSAYTGDFFKVGVENVTALKNFCEQKNYTAKLIGYALSYTVFVPVDEQCKIQITTKKVDNINEISTVQGDNSFKAKTVTATSDMQTNLNNYYNTF